MNPDYYVLLDSKEVEDINCRELIRKPNTQSPHSESLNLAGNKKEALNFIIRQINDVDLSHLDGLIIYDYKTLDKIESAKNENKPETGERFQREFKSIEAQL